MSDPEWWAIHTDHEIVKKEKRVWELSSDRVEEIVVDALAEKLGFDPAEFAGEDIKCVWDKRCNLTVTITQVTDITMEEKGE